MAALVAAIHVFLSEIPWLPAGSPIGLKDVDGGHRAGHDGQGIDSGQREAALDRGPGRAQRSALWIRKSAKSIGLSLMIFSSFSRAIARAIMMWFSICSGVRRKMPRVPLSFG